MSFGYDRLFTSGSIVPRRPCRTRKYKIDRSALLAILENSTTSVKVFLPKRYGEVVSDEGIEDINSRVLLYLVYKGTCPKSNSYVLELQRQQVS